MKQNARWWHGKCKTEQIVLSNQVHFYATSSSKSVQQRNIKGIYVPLLHRMARFSRKNTRKYKQGALVSGNIWSLKSSTFRVKFNFGCDRARLVKRGLLLRICQCFRRFCSQLLNVWKGTFYHRTTFLPDASERLPNNNIFISQFISTYSPRTHHGIHVLNGPLTFVRLQAWTGRPSTPLD